MNFIQRWSAELAEARRRSNAPISSYLVAMEFEERRLNPKPKPTPAEISRAQCANTIVFLVDLVKGCLIHGAGIISMFYLAGVVLTAKYGIIAGFVFVLYLGWSVNRRMNPDED